MQIKLTALIFLLTSQKILTSGRIIDHGTFSVMIDDNSINRQPTPNPAAFAGMENPLSNPNSLPGSQAGATIAPSLTAISSNGMPQAASVLPNDMPPTALSTVSLANGSLPMAMSDLANAVIPQAQIGNDPMLVTASSLPVQAVIPQVQSQSDPATLTASVTGDPTTANSILAAIRSGNGAADMLRKPMISNEPAMPAITGSGSASTRGYLNSKSKDKHPNAISIIEEDLLVVPVDGGQAAIAYDLNAVDQFGHRYKTGMRQIPGLRQGAPGVPTIVVPEDRGALNPDSWFTFQGGAKGQQQVLQQQQLVEMQQPPQNQLQTMQWQQAMQWQQQAQQQQMFEQQDLQQQLWQMQQQTPLDLPSSLDDSQMSPLTGQSLRSDVIGQDGIEDQQQGNQRDTQGQQQGPQELLWQQDWRQKDQGFNGQVDNDQGLDGQSIRRQPNIEEDGAQRFEDRSMPWIRTPSSPDQDPSPVLRRSEGRHFVRIHDDDVAVATGSGFGNGNGNGIVNGNGQGKGNDFGIGNGKGNGNGNGNVQGKGNGNGNGNGKGNGQSFSRGPPIHRGEHKQPERRHPIQKPTNQWRCLESSVDAQSRVEKLVCPPGLMLASFGLASLGNPEGSCHPTGVRRPGACHLDLSASLREHCQGRAVCDLDFVGATNLSSTCPGRAGASSRVIVEYECSHWVSKPSPANSTSEHCQTVSNNGTLSCPNDQVILGFGFGFYGEIDGSCSKGVAPGLCSRNVMTDLTAQCVGRNACKVDVNAKQFGSACTNSTAPMTLAANFKCGPQGQVTAVNATASRFSSNRTYPTGSLQLNTKGNGASHASNALAFLTVTAFVIAFMI